MARPVRSRARSYCHPEAVLPYSFSSTIISISTAMPAGSVLMPTAERAWRPLSPQRLISRSEAPLATLGVSAKVREPR